MDVSDRTIKALKNVYTPHRLGTGFAPGLPKPCQAGVGPLGRGWREGRDAEDGNRPEPRPIRQPGKLSFLPSLGAAGALSLLHRT